jgi:hypothetical protein
MRFLRQSTQTDVVIGPVWATADGALKADLAYDASGINCDVYKVATKADVTLANSSGDGYFRAGSAEAQYILTLSTGHTDTIGRLRLTLSATGYYMKPEDFMVLDEAVYDWLVGTAAPNTTTPPTTADIADKVVGRNIAGGSDTGRTVGKALALSANKVTITGASNPFTMTVYATDDTASLWTAAVTIDETTGAITAIDPA